MDEFSKRNVRSIPNLLCAIASGQGTNDKKHDLIFLAAAKLIEDLEHERLVNEYCIEYMRLFAKWRHEGKFS